MKKYADEVAQGKREIPDDAQLKGFFDNLVDNLSNSLFDLANGAVQGIATAITQALSKINYNILLL